MAEPTISSPVSEGPETPLLACSSFHSDEDDSDALDTPILQRMELPEAQVESKVEKTSQRNQRNEQHDERIVEEDEEDYDFDGLVQYFHTLGTGANSAARRKRWLSGPKFNSLIQKVKGPSNDDSVEQEDESKGFANIMHIRSTLGPAFVSSHDRNSNERGGRKATRRPPIPSWN